jgi:integrase
VRHSNRVSSKRKVRTKPEKPHPDFPLFPHATGRWAKKVLGQLHYFGKWDDPQSALEQWLEDKDAILAGRKPRRNSGKALSVYDACNLYLDFIEDKVNGGRLAEHWYQDIKRTCEIVCETLGKNWSIESLTIEDFAALGKRFFLKPGINEKGKPCMVPASPVTAKSHIHRVRGMFNWLMKNGKVKSVPQFGSGFDAPEQAELDRHKRDKPAKYLTRQQIRALLRATKGDDPASQRMHAAILLAINTGCQNEDIETLRFRHIDWKGGWYIQPRKKSGKPRRAKLWRRTLAALNRMIGDRERDPDAMVFVSKSGGVFRGRNCLAKEFPAFRDAAEIKTPGAGFQWLRHSFITEADQLADRVAVQISGGHAHRSITDNYVHRVYDQRLIAISKHVEQWLTGKVGAA